MANLARQANFDLLDGDGWQMLDAEIRADFPYLTAGELLHIIKRGIKGKLDKYKSAPLNFTRVYQWVEKSAPEYRSYWRHKFPAALRLAELLEVEKPLLEQIREQGQKPNESLLRTAIKQLVESKHYAARTAQGPHPRVALAAGPVATWCAEFPDYAVRWGDTMY